MIMVAVEVKNLSFQYPDGHAALDGVSLSAAEGETVGLIGPNGAGKSTLLMHLNGILPDVLRDPPAVFIHGLPVVKANLFRIRREVGLLFENPEDQFISPTVGEDVAFGPRQWGRPDAETAEAVRSALADVGLAGFERRSPQHLSNGEKQRVCLAGILVSNPKVLALDEPTRALDPRGRRRLMAILRGVAATQIVATHDLEFVAELCDTAVVLDGGRVVASGPAAEILADETLMLEHGLETPALLKLSLRG
jgi:energy-coupling factor transporter ATP-binding protein EcfA2